LPSADVDEISTIFPDFCSTMCFWAARTGAFLQARLA